MEKIKTRGGDETVAVRYFKKSEGARTKTNRTVRNYLHITSDITFLEKAKNPIRLAKATATVAKVTEYYDSILGESTPVPKIILRTSEDFCGLYDPETPEAIILDPKDGLNEHTIAHEAAHRARHIIINKAAKNTEQGDSSKTDYKITEEACAIFGDAAYSTRRIVDKEERKKEIIDFLMHRYSSKIDAVTTALMIVDETKRVEKLVYGPSPHLRMGPTLLNIISPIEDAYLREKKSPRLNNIIGTGFSLILFMVNDYDAEETCRQALTLPIKELQHRVWSAITGSNANFERIKGEIEKQKSK